MKIDLMELYPSLIYIKLNRGYLKFVPFNLIRLNQGVESISFTESPNNENQFNGMLSIINLYQINTGVFNSIKSRGRVYLIF